MSIKALADLGPGSLVDMARLARRTSGDVDHGDLVARGEVVVVGGNYGVRVHEVVSAEARIRTLE